MSPRRRLLVFTLLALVVAVGGSALAAGLGGADGPLAGRLGGPTGFTATPTPTPEPTPKPPLGGTELYGYLPYWQMNDVMAAYLRDAPLSTLALFSVTARRTGAIDNRPTGYRRITGEIGRRLIDEAQARGARVELVFTSFGADRNGILFGRLPIPRPSPSPSLGATPGPTPIDVATLAPVPPAGPPPWKRTVRELTDLANELGLDGVNVDVERLDEVDRPAYAAFLAELRAALRAANQDASLSVATEAGRRGTGNAAAAAAAGVDRIFLMGYDYHWSGSQPGASSPIDRLDGEPTLRSSIDRYVEAGVPRRKILLGLPLYGMRWRSIGPDRSWPTVGDGVAWVPARNLELLLDPAFAPERDALEAVEYFIGPDDDTFLLTYYDSPETLRLKLALARDAGLAGGGFWAMGYERGLPGYLSLMRDFRDGQVAREELPAR